MKKKVGLLVLFIVLCLLTIKEPCFARSEDDLPGITPHSVPNMDMPMSIDGVLDEDAWSSALALELKYETTPGENIPAPVRSEVLMFNSSTHLYIAFRCYDPEPEAIRAFLADRDSAWNDDRVVAVLDTFNDERRAFVFCINPLGVQMDYTNTANNDDTSWDTIWESAGKITDWGWAAEIAIPFNSISFQRGKREQTWGFVAARHYPRSQSHWFSIVPSDRNNNCSLCQALKITGFEGISPGNNVEITPTLTSVRTDSRPAFPSGGMEKLDQKSEAGLTARWGITPNLTLSGTINPDFSQVEADALQLDINRTFALYYPERRPFFLEGRNLFNNLITTRINAVYTRAIADPSWGLKFTGKEGANAFGVYAAHDEITNLLFPGSQGSGSTSLAQENVASVFRYSRDIWNNSSIGVLFTDREGDDYFNRLCGADGLIRFTPTDRFQFQVLRSSTRYQESTARTFNQPGGRFDGNAVSLFYQHAERNWNAWGLYELFDSDFRADLGFVSRAGYQLFVYGFNRIWWRENTDLISQIVIGGEGEESNETGEDSALLWRDYEIWFQAQGALQSSLYLRAGWRRRNFQNLSSSQRFVDGNYYFQPVGTIRLGIGFNWDDTIDYEHVRNAKLIGLYPSVNLNLGSHVSLYLAQTLEQLSVQGDRLFLANATQMMFVYQFNSKAFVRSILQYTDIRRNNALYTRPVEPLSRGLFSQFLFSYEINPRTVLFLGYSDNYFGSRDLSLLQSDRTFFAKIGYAWQL